MKKFFFALTLLIGPNLPAQEKGASPIPNPLPADRQAGEFRTPH